MAEAVTVEKLVEIIRSCELCRNVRLNGYVNVESKPYLDCEVYQKWIPEEKIKCLFIAESPPPDESLPGGEGRCRGRFFYNPEGVSVLRCELFELLEIKASGEEGLQEFKKRGYFLIDAIECRVVKEGRGSKRVLKKAAKNCLKILRAKLNLAKSRGARRIVVLGATALNALLELEESQGLGSRSQQEGLGRVRVSDVCGEIVKVGEFEVMAFPLPLPQAGVHKEKCYTNENKKKLRHFVNDP